MDLHELIRAALDEDLGPGDLTTEATVPRDLIGVGTIRAKQPLVVCGTQVVRRVFEITADRMDGYLHHYTVDAEDGVRVEAGAQVAEVEGEMRVLLVAERLALNLLMKLSGIATHVATFVAAAEGGTLRVVDTRKTTPLLRDLEKLAVRCGGATNHRHGLYDGVLVKDNHVDAVGSLTEAVRLARAAAHHLVRVEVEVRSLAELDEALGTAADVVLLDNMDDPTLIEAVRRIRATRPALLIEASGNMTPERIAAIKGIGVDFVSAGGLIHQARWADLSMKIRRA
jgi:nicotinate-nucleotide pyrophosphorylase (carboxylating)